MARASEAGRLDVHQVIGGDGFGSTFNRSTASNAGQLYYSRVTRASTAASTSCRRAAASRNAVTARPPPSSRGWYRLPAKPPARRCSRRATLACTVRPTTRTRGARSARPGCRPTSASAISGCRRPTRITSGSPPRGPHLLVHQRRGELDARRGAADNGLSMSAVAYDPTWRRRFTSRRWRRRTKGHSRKSTNGGASWTRIDGAGFRPASRSCARQARRSLYAATHLGVYVSGDERELDAVGQQPCRSSRDRSDFSNRFARRAATYGRGFLEILR